MPRFTPHDMTAWCGGRWDGRPDVATGISIDTRTLRAGDCFVALRGTHADGHRFVEAAAARGAASAIVAVEWSGADGMALPLLRVPDPLEALQALARGYRARVNPLCVGVTGSAGKSTVKEMTAALLSRILPTAATQGNWNNDIGLPLSLLAMEPGTRAGVFEVGTNHPGEIGALCRILEPAWGVVTNVGPVHTEFFGSVAAIAAEKADLLRSLPAEGVSFLNADDAFVETFRAAAPGEVVTVSLSQPADYRLIADSVTDTSFRLREQRTGEEPELPRTLPGAYNLSNTLLAVSVARRLQCTWEQIAAGIQAYRPLPMRWEVSEIDGRRFVNDAYNANPVSMRAAIRAFQETSAGHPSWLVLGEMRELGETEAAEHRGLGGWLAGYAWAGVLVVGKAGRLIAEGLEQAADKAPPIFRCDTAEAASRVVMEHVGSGDAVFLKASRAMHLETVIQRIKEDRSWSA